MNLGSGQIVVSDKKSLLPEILLKIKWVIEIYFKQGFHAIDSVLNSQFWDNIGTHKVKINPRLTLEIC